MMRSLVLGFDAEPYSCEYGINVGRVCAKHCIAALERLFLKTAVRCWRGDSEQIRCVPDLPGVEDSDRFDRAHEGTMQSART